MRAWSSSISATSAHPVLKSVTMAEPSARNSRTSTTPHRAASGESAGTGEPSSSTASICSGMRSSVSPMVPLAHDHASRLHSAATSGAKSGVMMVSCAMQKFASVYPDSCERMM